MLRPTPVELDETRYLLYRSMDMQQFEMALDGQSWQKAIFEMGERRLVLMLFYGLRFKHKNLTLQQVGEWLDEARARGVRLNELWQSVTEALVTCGFLPPASENGVPTTTDGTAPVPSPGGISG